MKKLLTLALCLLCLLPTALAGCSSDTTDTADTTASGVNENPAETTSTGSAKTNAEIIAERYAGKDFGGAAVQIASISAGKFPYQRRADLNEIFFETESGDVMNDSIYKRNALAEELLNMTVEPVWLGDAKELVSSATKSIQAGDDAFDIMVTRLDYTMNMAAQKLLVDCNTLDVIDTDDSWWNRRLVDNFTINGKLFPIAGDINFFDDYATCMMLFNMRLAENYGLDDLYSKVKDGTWTLDYFMSTALDATVDLNGDGVLDPNNDQWGYATDSAGLIYFIYSAGLSLSHTDDSGKIALTYNEKLVNVVEKAYDFIVTSKGVTAGNTYGKIFADNRKLYYYLNLSSLEPLRDMEDDFGALPSPKYDEAAEEYTAYVSNGTTTAFSIPTTNGDAEDAAIVIDAMSALSTDTVRAALYDYLLTEKLLRNEESIEMLNTYILGSGQYDLAGDLEWAQTLRSIYAAVITESSNSFVSKYEAVSESVNTSLSTFLEAFN